MGNAGNLFSMGVSSTELLAEASAEEKATKEGGLEERERDLSLRGEIGGEKLVGEMVRLVRWEREEWELRGEERE